jgi:hypothetical protein
MTIGTDAYWDTEHAWGAATDYVEPSGPDGWSWIIDNATLGSHYSRFVTNQGNSFAPRVPETNYLDDEISAGIYLDSAYGLMLSPPNGNDANPAYQYINNVGGQATYNIDVTSLYGSPPTVSLAVAGLPPDATYQFSSVSVAPGGTSTLTITAGSTPGVFRPTITASFEGRSAYMSVVLVVPAKVTFLTNPASSALISWGSCANPSYGNDQSVFLFDFGSVTACYIPSGYSLSSWSCSGGLACSGSNDPTTITFTGPGTITLNLKNGSLSNPVSTLLMASAAPSNPTAQSSFTVSGTLTASGAGVPDETVVLVFGWSTSIATVTTGSYGSYTYSATAPSSAGSYNVDAFFLGDYRASEQYLPSETTAMITVTAIAGVKNVVTINSGLSVTEPSLNCENPATTDCFSIQQNIAIQVPGSSAEYTYWAQNVIYVQQNAFGQWEAAAAFNVFNSANTIKACQPGIAPACLTGLGFTTFTLPATFTMTSVISGEQLVITNDFGSFTFNLGSSSGNVISTPPPYPFLNPELAIVGDRSSGNPPVGHTATFGSGTSGQVQSFLELSSGAWQNAATQTLLSTSNTQTGETSANLSWTITSGNVAEFTYLQGASSEGISFWQ